MKSVKCDQCAAEAAHHDRLDYRLDHRGSMSGDVWDFCSENCLLDWALTRLRFDREFWREQARAGVQGGKKR